MERMYRSQAMPRELRFSPAMENPIETELELDNKAFNIEDGGRKSLGYLDYCGTIAKGTLAAQGAIKLCPSCKGKFMEHYGASAPIRSINQENTPPIPHEDTEEKIENEWDNIFLARANDN